MSVNFHVYNVPEYTLTLNSPYSTINNLNIWKWSQPKQIPWSRWVATIKFIKAFPNWLTSKALSKSIFCIKDWFQDHCHIRSNALLCSLWNQKYLWSRINLVVGSISFYWSDLNQNHCHIRINITAIVIQWSQSQAVKINTSRPDPDHNHCQIWIDSI